MGDSVSCLDNLLLSIAHLHNSVMRALHSGSCSYWLKKKMASHSGGGFTCCVPGCFSNSKRDVQTTWITHFFSHNFKKRTVSDR